MPLRGWIVDEVLRGRPDPGMFKCRARPGSSPGRGVSPRRSIGPAVMVAGRSILTHAAALLIVYGTRLTAHVVCDVAGTRDRTR